MCRKMHKLNRIEAADSGEASVKQKGESRAQFPSQ